MGDPLYLADPAKPDERDRVVRGIDKTQPAPAQATYYNLLPNANYVYDPALGLWIPQEQAASALVVLLKQIAEYSEDAAGTIESTIAAWLSGLKRHGTPDLLYGTTTPRVRTVTDGDLIQADGTRQGTAYVHDFGVIDANARRKFVGIDAGAYVSPGAGGTAITFTGVNLLNRVGKFVFNVTDWMRHEVVSVVDPAGGAVGTITVRPAIPTASAVFLIPFTSVPHAYATTTDSWRMTNIAPEWSHYVEPTTFISQTSAPANATYQFGPIPCLDYGRAYFQIVWSTAGTRTAVFNLYGKMDSAAWAGAGAIPASYLINSWPQYTAAGLQFGSAAATNGIIVCRFQDASMFDSLMVEMTTAATDGNNTTVTAYYGLAGNGR